MSLLRFNAIERRPALYERLRFNPTLEALGFRRLAESDLAGCRAALDMLLGRLDLTRSHGQAREVILLLLELLQHVNRCLYAGDSERSLYHAHRISLVAEFGALTDPEDARRAFLPALDRILAPLSTGGSKAHPTVERAQAFIEENYPGRLSLSIVAEHLQVSPNHLSRLFRRETGRTLTAYIQRVRLEHALLLLANGGRSLSEIAHLVGYRNYRDFYRNFVKHENASPRQLQRRLSIDPPALPRGNRGGIL